MIGETRTETDLIASNDTPSNQNNEGLANQSEDCLTRKPKFVGRLLAAMSAFLFAVALVLIADWNQHANSELANVIGGHYRQSFQFLLIGAIYGAVSGSAFFATIIIDRWCRFTAQSIVALVGAGVIVQFSNKPFSTFLATTLGLVTFQCIWLGLLKPIYWKRVRFHEEIKQDTTLGSPSGTRQFAVGDLIGLTISAAIIFMIMKLHESPLNASTYWFVFSFVWVLMPLVAILMYASGTPLLSGPHRLALILFAISMTIAAPVIVAVCEVTLANNRAPFSGILSGYASIMIGYFCLVAVFSFLSAKLNFQRN